DTNKDGKLSRAELAAAPAVLLKLDENDDEMVTARELVPNATQSADLYGAGMMAKGATSKPGAARGNKMLMLLPAPGKAPPELVQRMRDRYGASEGEGKGLTRKDLGLDESTFAALDANQDGVLDDKEIESFVKRPPDVE